MNTIKGMFLHKISRNTALKRNCTRSNVYKTSLNDSILPCIYHYCWPYDISP